jgi:hypothetical protein
MGSVLLDKPEVSHRGHAATHLDEATYYKPGSKGFDSR